MSWWQAVLVYVVPSALGLVGAVTVARLTGRSSDHAAQSTAAAAKEANAVDGFDKLVKALEKRVDDVEAQNVRLAARVGELDHEVGALRNERAENRALIRRLWSRLQVALAEITRLGGVAPPDNVHDAERVALILEADS